MRAFQKCMNRANIKMVYSEGFNPHQKMSFALPLGVGITSEAEYMDAQVADGQDPEAIKEALQKVTGPGFDILSVRILSENAAKAMASVRYAGFEVFDRIASFSEEDVRSFLAQPEIICTKTTKKGDKTLDIRPLIISFGTDGNKMRLILRAGSEDNLKPELLLKAFYEWKGISFDKDNLQIKRTELYGEDMSPLEELGTEPPERL